jgi:hypothetical protein
MTTHSTAFWGSFFNRYFFGQGIIPVVDKVPRIKNWQRGGLKAFESIDKVFGRIDERYPGNLSIGLPTGFPLKDGGHLLVMDVDDRNGGEEALGALPSLPETAMVKTNGGEHYYFRTDKALPSTVRPDGIELKGAGSYVVVPPSPGKEWLRHAHDCPIAEAPEWLTATTAEPEPERKLIMVQRYPLTGETSFLSQPYISPVKGQRHYALLRLAGGYAARGLVSEQHKLLLVSSAVQAGLEAEDALRVVSAIFAKELRKQNSPTSTVLTARPSHQQNQGRGQGRVYRLGPPPQALGLNDRKVLKAALETFLEHDQGRWEHLKDAWKRSLSERHIAEKAGCARMTAWRSLNRNCAAGMLWRSPKPYYLKNGWAHQYRPTYIGIAFAEQNLGVNPVRN